MTPLEAFCASIPGGVKRVRTEEDRFQAYLERFISDKPNDTLLFYAERLLNKVRCHAPDGSSKPLGHGEEMILDRIFCCVARIKQSSEQVKAVAEEKRKAEK